MKLAQSRVHFIGIGGIGMCGLAELLRNMGAKVQGSDLQENPQTKHLRALGVEIQIGQKAENIGDAEVVVYSSAVKGNNPEYREARARKIPLIPRAEALAEMMRLKRGVAVGGSHGKTTTTSMAASIFLEAKVEPTIVIGGRLDLIKSTAKLGQGEWLIAEADESDGSFLKLSPEITIITNIDNDHMDHYGTMENLKKSYFDFASKIPFYGLAIVCGDDPLIREVFADFNKRVLFYGFDESNDLRIQGERGHYEVFCAGKKLGQMQLEVSGKYNALNAAAALAAGLEAGFSFETCVQGLSRFLGADRRFQHKGSFNGVEVYDDYGHHPTEVAAALGAFRERFPGRRVVAAFQPHRYSRTLLCWPQFLTCFKDADILFLADIYAAGEAPLANISSERLLAEIEHPNKQLLPSGATWSDRARAMLPELRTGDVFVTLGAGDIYKLGVDVLDLADGTGGASSASAAGKK